jgi:transcriptional regulator with XRE-family HTH domain
VFTRVFSLAKKEGWSVRELAAHMGISFQYAYYVRAGDRAIGLAFIEGARRAFPDYPLDWLFPADDPDERSA